MAHVSGSLSLLHALPAYAMTRSRQLGLKRSVYLCILLSNFLNRPSRALPHGTPDKKLKRVLMQVTMPEALRRGGQEAAEEQGVSFSTLMESLIIRDARRKKGEEGLTIHAVAGRPAARLGGATCRPVGAEIPNPKSPNPKGARSAR